jgi:hypothetical protein
VKTLWFIMPANGREDLARVCLRQLRRTCDLLEGYGIRASAVVIADDGNLETADGLGFATVERDNKPLGRKFNDGYELAGMAGVDYMVPLGSDDWVDPHWVGAVLPPDDTMRCSRGLAMVSPDREQVALLDVPHVGGHGIRVIPRAMLEPCGFRPAGEDRDRAVDVSVLRGIGRSLGQLPRIDYFELHPYQVVDRKSPANQLNTLEMCHPYQVRVLPDPFGRLARFYPVDAIDEMRALTAEAVTA